MFVCKNKAMLHGVINLLIVRDNKLMPYLTSCNMLGNSAPAHNYGAGYNLDQFLMTNLHCLIYTIENHNDVCCE